MYLPQDETDRAAVARCVAGDRDAFAVLVERYQRVMYTTAYRLLGNEADALDAAQAAFVKAYQQLASFDPQYRFFSWIYRILRNECLNMLRARKADDPLEPGVAAEGTPFDSARTAAQHRDIQRALQALSVDEREVIVLRHFAELRYDEIATTLRIPASTVKSRLYSARQHLGEMLRGWRTA